MKLKFEFETVDMVDQKILVPIGYDDFKGVIHMNDTTEDIVKLLVEDTTEDELVKKMCEIYDGAEEDIRASVRKVVEHLRSDGLIED